jgi:nucleoside-diphosphate-sugar epimerase
MKICIGVRMKVLLTGGSGFLGRSLRNMLKDFELVLIGRNAPILKQNEIFHCANINGTEGYADILNGVDVLVHAAARVHVMKESASKAEEEYNKVNTLGTINIARQALAHGVKKFIFISSIKVNGEETNGIPFYSGDLRNPQDEYGKSKAKAEELLIELCENSEMEIIIIRPPLVYGPGVQANFGALMRIVSKAIPTPFGAIADNRRSMIYVENLAHFIVKVMTHSEDAGGIYLISDDNDLSTKTLISFIAKGFNKRVLNVPIPGFILYLLGKITGKEAIISRLIGSLQVDIVATKKKFGWEPPFSSEYGISKTAEPLIKEE